MPGLSSGHDGQEGPETTEVDVADYATALYTLLKIVRSVGNCPKADENRVSNSNDEDERSADPKGSDEPYECRFHRPGSLFFPFVRLGGYRTSSFHRFGIEFLYVFFQRARR